MSTLAFKKLNLPLPSEMHEAILVEAKALGIPATRLIRSVLDAWLEDRRRTLRRAEIRRFATACAGTEFDLDQELEAAAIQDLSRFCEEDDEAR